jgi:tetratricopeptide (TPR) repeat protein
VVLEERELRERIANGSLNPRDYIMLAYRVWRAGRSEDKSRALLEDALKLPFSSADRAALIKTCGSYASKPEVAVFLGEQAISLTLQCQSSEALATRLLAQGLVAWNTWQADRAKAESAAKSGLELFAQLSSETGLSDMARFEIHLEAVALNGLMRRPDEASSACQIALELAPDELQRALCYTDLGRAYREAGRLDQAREALLNAIALKDLLPEDLVWPYYELGMAERAMGMLPAAGAKLRKAASICDENSSASLTQLSWILGVIAEISSELEDYASAAEAWRRLVELPPLDDAVHWAYVRCLAECQSDLGDFSSSRANFESIIQSPMAPDEEQSNAKQAVLYQRALVAEEHYDNGRYALCIKECESLVPQIARDPDWHTVLLLILGHSYLATRRHRRAREVYQAVIACTAASESQRSCARSGLERCQRDWWRRLFRN